MPKAKSRNSIRIKIQYRTTRSFYKYRQQQNLFLKAKTKQTFHNHTHPFPTLLPRPPQYRFQSHVGRPYQSYCDYCDIARRLSRCMVMAGCHDC
ncbi:hypothetical protein BJ508DRAFT_57791 [Ascobolus immersus RN42]|uniref:Uncharacterized protein n=1 Tax=Ascobolus immersus RN42 TaxID=1160509 RepID=A0A3N4HLW0_ASCIM|nr:hypothetical protein BJ508DRAFT_57791 [Ascobolus immersus RN42]